MARKAKYPGAADTIRAFYAEVSDSYQHPDLDETGDLPGRKKQELLAEEFGISRLKVRKILITTGDLVYPETGMILHLQKEGRTPDEICKKLGMARSTMNSFLPYNKGLYKLAEVSAAADRTRVYRERKAAVLDLHQELKTGLSSEQCLALWRAVCLFSGYPFMTSEQNGRNSVKFWYVVSAPGGSGGRHYNGISVDGYGNELLIYGREKGISRSSVDYAFDIVKQANSFVTGPKQLKIYGASYIYAVFRRFGLIGSPQ